MTIEHGRRAEFTKRIGNAVVCIDDLGDSAEGYYVLPNGVKLGLKGDNCARLWDGKQWRINRRFGRCGKGRWKPAKHSAPVIPRSWRLPEETERQVG